MTAASHAAPGASAEAKTAAPEGFPSLENFEEVRDAVNADLEFRRATDLVDASVLLKIGDFSVWMKWYRGQIIDVHEGPDILGFTFALVAPLETWREVFDLPRTCYQPWAKLYNFGEIAIEGNVLEATRLLEATYILTSHIEALGTGRSVA
jgi:hypothetical protein